MTTIVVAIETDGEGWRRRRGITRDGRRRWWVKKGSTRDGKGQAR